jgi:hypothetical protein
MGKIEILGRKKKCGVEENFSKKGLAQPRPIYKGLNGLKPKARLHLDLTDHYYCYLHQTPSHSPTS